MPDSNLQWAARFAGRFDPTFRFRWEIYKRALREQLAADTVWLDIGCGDNADIAAFGGQAGWSCGVDIRPPDGLSEPPFVRADIYCLPFAADSVDFISLRFVAEHLRDTDKALGELHRILRPGGRVLIMTTNKNSPMIALPRILPSRAKNWILRTLFHAADEGLFPTFHRLNSKKDFAGLRSMFDIVRFDYLQDTNVANRALFCLLFFWHLATKSVLKSTRSNIIALLQKK